MLYAYVSLNRLMRFNSIQFIQCTTYKNVNVHLGEKLKHDALEPLLVVIYMFSDCDTGIGSSVQRVLFSLPITFCDARCLVERGKRDLKIILNFDSAVKHVPCL